MNFPFAATKAARKGGAKRASGSASPAGSQAEEHELCSETLRFGAQAVALGLVGNAVAAFAAEATGRPLHDVLKLFSTPGYAPGQWLKYQKETGEKSYTWAKDLPQDERYRVEHPLLPPQYRTDAPTGFARLIFGWRTVGANTEEQLRVALSEPAFEIYRAFFQGLFGAEWQAAMRHDIERLHELFGETAFGGRFARPAGKAKR